MLNMRDLERDDLCSLFNLPERHRQRRYRTWDGGCDGIAEMVYTDSVYDIAEDMEDDDEAI